MTLFTKWQAYYAYATKIPPARCTHCIHWRPNGPACALVESAGNPTPGEIRGTGTCSLWNAGLARIELLALARGRGEGQSGVLPGNLRVRVEQYLVTWPHTDIPSDVKRHLLLPPP